MSQAFAKAVAEATRIVIQTMAKLQAQRVPNTAGPKLGSPTLKHPNFNWEVSRQVHQMEGIHPRGEKCVIYI